jgi:thioester reductase-like protein
MRVQIAGPNRVSRATGAARRTVLLTGASGVVGRALLRRLRDVDVVGLVHRSPVSGPDVTTVPGDITEPSLGLAEPAYAELTARVDAVIHCAAVTEFNRTDGSLEATNIAGTEHVAAFAAAAGAVLYHVSTAFVHTTADGDRGRTAIGYAASKLAAEQVVRSSGAAHVIIRPSVVIGDSVTGEIAAFQGLYRVASGLFAGLVPMIPFDPSWPIDFVPADVVADSIACLVENRVSEGEFWLSAGDQALRLDEAVAVAGLAIELEAAAAALEQVASASATAGDNEALLARALSVRFATERAIERVVMPAAATLGGMSFIESPEIAYLLGATRALAFHPPSRAAAAGPLARYLAGGPLILLRVTVAGRPAARRGRGGGRQVRPAANPSATAVRRRDDGGTRAGRTSARHDRARCRSSGRRRTHDTTRWDGPRPSCPRHSSPRRR